MRKSQSHFMTIEGGDGSGKSSVLKHIAQVLQGRGFSVVPTREPGGSVLGEKIREVVLFTKGEQHVSPIAELLLFLAARAQHITSLIKPALDNGKVVICDRFNDSTLAYQSAGRGLDIAEVKEYCMKVCGDILPTLTLYLDVDPKVGLERAKARHHIHGENQDRIEQEGLAFHEGVRSRFLTIAKEDPDRVKIVDASQPLEQVLKRAEEVVLEWILKK